MNIIYMKETDPEYKKLINLNTYLEKEEYKLYEENMEKYNSNWEKMKLITKFNSIITLPGEYINYFKRPFYSRFLLSEKLKLYSFNFCSSIPHVLTTYPMNIRILFDPETIESKLNGYHNHKNNFIREREQKKTNEEKPKPFILPYETTISLITV